MRSQCITTVERTRAMPHRLAHMPRALQPSAILQPAVSTPTPHGTTESNNSATPQSVNHALTFSDFVRLATRIDDSSSSATSDATPTLTAANQTLSGRGARRSLRVSPTSASPTHVRVPRQREFNEQNRENSNLFIRNLDVSIDQAELENIFGVYGTILSSAVMRNIHTGESLGTAFVRMSTHEEAQCAMEKLHNCTVGTRAICVQWAKRHDGAPVGEARRKIMKLFVRNIPLDCTVETLEMLFERYGCVRQVTLHKDTAQVEDPAMERLIAFVIYTEEGAAERAATAVHNTKPFPSCYGIPVMIKLAEDQARHDRARGQPARQPSPATPLQQQQQQQQQRHQHRQPLYVSINHAEEGNRIFERATLSPECLSNSSSVSSNVNHHHHYNRSGPVLKPLGDYYAAYNAEIVLAGSYLPPSALTPTATSARTMAVHQQPCTPLHYHLPPPETVPLHATRVMAGAAHPPLCSPLTSPLSFSVASPLRNAAPEGSFAALAMEGQRPAMTFARAAPQPIATNVCTGTPHNTRDGRSARGTPERGITEVCCKSGGGGGGGVSIPNPRSATLATVQPPQRRTLVEIGGSTVTSTATRAMMSPCLSVDSASAPLSPAAAEDHSTEGLRSPVLYRHNPYSMSSSALVY